MNIGRPRLLAASLVVAVVVSAVGGYVWAQIVADDDAATVDVVLDDPGDRTIPTDAGGITTNAALDGQPLPAVTVSDTDGQDIDTASFVGGDPMVINLWFSTCAPCAKELPEFAEVHSELGDEVRFIGINPTDSVPVMERFAGERDVTYELYRDDLAEFIDIVGAVNFPVTLFVTSDGTIVEQTGVIDADGLREKIANLQDLEEAA